MQPHGTYARYQKAGGGCRCDACRAAARDYHRAYRRRARDRWVSDNYGSCVRGLGWPRYPGPSKDWPS